jgi:hypothetical protein
MHGTPSSQLSPAQLADVLAQPAIPASEIVDVEGMRSIRSIAEFRSIVGPEHPLYKRVRASACLTVRTTAHAGLGHRWHRTPLRTPDTRAESVRRSRNASLAHPAHMRGRHVPALPAEAYWIIAGVGCEGLPDHMKSPNMRRLDKVGDLLEYAGGPVWLRSAGARGCTEMVAIMDSRSLSRNATAFWHRRNNGAGAIGISIGGPPPKFGVQYVWAAVVDVRPDVLRALAATPSVFRANSDDPPKARGLLEEEVRQIEAGRSLAAAAFATAPNETDEKTNQSAAVRRVSRAPPPWAAHCFASQPVLRTGAARQLGMVSLEIRRGTDYGGNAPHMFKLGVVEAHHDLEATHNCTKPAPVHMQLFPDYGIHADAATFSAVLKAYPPVPAPSGPPVWTRKHEQALGKWAPRAIWLWTVEPKLVSAHEGPGGMQLPATFADYESFSGKRGETAAQGRSADTLLLRRFELVDVLCIRPITRDEIPPPLPEPVVEPPPADEPDTDRRGRRVKKKRRAARGGNPALRQSVFEVNPLDPAADADAPTAIYLANRRVQWLREVGSVRACVRACVRDLSQSVSLRMLMLASARSRSLHRGSTV